MNLSVIIKHDMQVYLTASMNNATIQTIQRKYNE